MARRLKMIFVFTFVVAGLLYPAAPARIFAGSPVSAAVYGLAAAPAFAAGPPLLTLDVREADLRDVLSALALKMGATVILATKEDKPVKITFQVKNVSPLQALELIVEKQGLTYLQRENLIIVGDQGTLQESFFNQLLLTRFNTFYVPAPKLIGFIKELGIPLKSITSEHDQNVLWVQGTAPALQKVRELINAVDGEENQLSLEYRTLTPTQIPPARAVELLAKAGVTLKRYLVLNNRLLVFDRELFSRWAELEALVKDLDTMDARKQKAFVYQLKNIVARDAANWLKEFDFGAGNEVKTVTFNNPEFGRELLVICPPEVENQVRSALSSLDGTRQKTRAPVAAASGKFAHQALNAKRSLLSEMSGVPVGSMHISSNLSGDDDNPQYVLWAEETPDKLKLLQDLAAKLGGGGGGGGTTGGGATP